MCRGEEGWGETARLCVGVFLFCVVFLYSCFGSFRQETKTNRTRVARPSARQVGGFVVVLLIVLSVWGEPSSLVEIVGSKVPCM